jgi:hypothetical protein
MKRFTLAALLFLLASVPFLSGCPGGGADPTSDGGSYTVTIDSSSNSTAVISITGTSPFNGQLNVPVDAAVTVTFDNASSLMALIGTNVTLRDSRGNIVPFTTKYNGTTVTLTPKAPLQERETYTATVSGLSLTNGALIKGMSWSFTTTAAPTPFKLASHGIMDNQYFGLDNYTFEDISATGVNSGVTGDDAAGQIPIGFTFRLYGVDYTTAFISTNGYLTFGAPDTTYLNYQFPSADGMPRIAPWFDDLVIDGPGKILYEVRGTAPNRRLIVQWLNVRHRLDSAGANRGDFEAILYEGTNQVEFLYKNANLAPYANGLSATIGINKGDGIDDVMLSCNNAIISDGYAVLFLPSNSYGGLSAPVTPLNGAVNVSRTLRNSLNTAFAFFNKPLALDQSAPMTMAETSTGTLVPGSAGIWFFGGTGAQMTGFTLLNQEALQPKTGYKITPLTVESGILDPNTNYTVTIGGSLRATDGTTLGTPVTWSFTTEGLETPPPN